MCDLNGTSTGQEHRDHEAKNPSWHVSGWLTGGGVAGWLAAGWLASWQSEPGYSK
jgi:hypothetical protein